MELRRRAAVSLSRRWLWYWVVAPQGRVSREVFLLMKRVQAVCVVTCALLVSTVALGQQVPPQRAPRPPLSHWEASSIVSTLQRLIDVGVTPQELKPAQAALQAYLQAEESFYQTMHDPVRLQAWQQIIDKLIAGQAPTEEDWAKVQGSEEMDKLYRAQEEARKKAATALVNCLQDYQLAELGASEKRRAAKDTVRQLAGHRGDPPDRWKEWMPQRIKDLVKRFGGNTADKMTQELTTFFQQVRNMPTDDFYAKTAQLVDQLTIILNGGQPEPREEQVNRAVNWFRDVLSGRTMAETLMRWIQQGVAPGTAPAAEGGQQ